MASVTLAESAKLAQDQLVAGVIEDIVVVNKFFEVLPFDGIDGNAVKYNRENVLGNTQVLGINGAITAKAAATFTQVTSSLTTVIGDAEVNGLIQATRSSDGNNQTAVQISSKAKSCSRQYQDMLINGSGAGDEFNGLINLCDASQEMEAGANGADLTFAMMDELLDLVTDKDGSADFLMAHRRTIRAYKNLLRAQGGATISETMTLPSGRTVMTYNGVPIFANDWIPTDQTLGGGTALTSMFAGTFDDGSRTHGIAGLTAENMAGINVVDVGEAEAADNHIWRVKWYCGLANFSRRGLACLKGLSN